MRHLQEVCCPSSAGPTSASSSLRRTSPPKGRSWRLPRGSPSMLRSPLWGSCLAPRRSPAQYLPWAPHPLSSSSRVKSSSRRTTQELRSRLWNGSTCRNKLCTMYLTRSGLFRSGVFLLVTNLLITILKARPHGSFSTSPIKSFQH